METTSGNAAAQLPVAREVLMDTRLQPAKATSRVETRRITLPPRLAAGFHRHNGPVFGNIVEGSVLFQIEGEAETVLKPGDTFYEPEDVPVRFDAGEQGAVFLAYFLLAEGQEPEIAFAAG